MATCKGKSISVAKFPIGRQSRNQKEAGQLRSNGKFCKASTKEVCKKVKNPKPKQRCKVSTTRRKSKRR